MNTATAEGISLTVKKRRAFSAVPDDILTDKSLSERARVLLAWLVGRPDNWVIKVSHVRALFRLSERQWSKARGELEVAGYYRQERHRKEDGTIRWQNEVWDTPMSYHPHKNAWMDKPSDGSPLGGKRGDIPTVNKNMSSKHMSSKPPPRRDAAPSLEWLACIDLELALERDAGRTIRSVSGLRRTILARYEANGGPDAAVIEELAKREEQRRQAELREAELARRTEEADRKAKAAIREAKAAIPPAPSSSLDERLARLNAARTARANT
jgi:hypothetical protein